MLRFHEVSYRVLPGAADTEDETTGPTAGQVHRREVNGVIYAFPPFFRENRQTMRGALDGLVAARLRANRWQYGLARASLLQTAGRTGTYAALGALLGALSGGGSGALVGVRAGTIVGGFWSAVAALEDMYYDQMDEFLADLGDTVDVCRAENLESRLTEVDRRLDHLSLRARRLRGPAMVALERLRVTLRSELTRLREQGPGHRANHA